MTISFLTILGSVRESTPPRPARLGYRVAHARTVQAPLRFRGRQRAREDAFNPAELLLTSIAACMIKSIERVAPVLEFDLRGVEVKLNGSRQDPPRIASIDYEIIVDSDEG